MGYQLQSVHSISPDDRHEYFVYLIEMYYNSPLRSWFDEHFSKTAQDLASKGVIVRGLDQYRFRCEISDLIHEHGFDGAFHRALYGDEMSESNIPYYLVSNKPPARFGDEDSLLLLLPLVDIPADYLRHEASEVVSGTLDCLYLEAITRVVVDAIRNKDLSSLTEHAVLCRGKIHKASVAAILNDAIAVKPKIFGVIEIDVKKLAAACWKRLSE